MRSPKFSIILPTYNRIALLPRAVESVLCQKHTNWELIIIDDGSTDNTKAYVNSLNTESIHYYYQENKGRSAARNLGLEKSTGEYICFLDSDDELLDDYLSHFQSIINDQNQKLILTGVRLANGKGYLKIVPHSNISKCIIQCLEGSFNLMPFCFHRSLINLKRFDEELYYGEDFNFMIPIIADNTIHTTNNDTSIVHQHSDRTINKVFNDINGGFIQLQKSVLQTLTDNQSALLNFVDSKTLNDIKVKKIQDYILTAAKFNFKEAFKINKKEPKSSINISRLLFQRIKGLIQS